MAGVSAVHAATFSSPLARCVGLFFFSFLFLGFRNRFTALPKPKKETQNYESKHPNLGPVPVQAERSDKKHRLPVSRYSFEHKRRAPARERRTFLRTLRDGRANICSRLLFILLVQLRLARRNLRASGPILWEGCSASTKRTPAADRLNI